MRPVRERNLGVVLRQVAELGPRSRAKIAVETGLNKSTVSSLVADLIEAGLLRDSPVEQRPASVGRPPHDVELAPEAPFVLGLGSEARMEYTTIGDLVNVAARLEAMARPGQTLLTADVAAAAGEGFAYNALGEHPLRGKRQAVQLLELAR